MDIELYFHGVPNGQKIFGKDDARDYLSLFYGGNDNDEPKLVVEIVSIGGKRYCCYNLLNYSKVVANDGRDGSYIGVTLKMDRLWTDIKRVYNLLFWVLKFRLNGICLKESGEVTNFTVGSFEQVEGELNAVRNEVYKEIEKLYSKSDFKELPQLGNVAKSGARYNINDYPNDALASAIEKNGYLVVSPFFPTRNELSAESRANKQIASIKASAEKEHDAIVAELNQRKQQCSKLSDENADLQSKVRKLYAELRQNAVRKEISAIVGEINGPLHKLVEKLDVLLPKQRSNDKDFMKQSSGKKSSWLFKLIKLSIPMLNLLLTLFLCAFLILPKVDSPTNIVAPSDSNFVESDGGNEGEMSTEAKADTSNNAEQEKGVNAVQNSDSKKKNE
ncbi:MAG: hypothetical protein IKR18_05485 [Bacteroidaceae bacterium]|nr:hypothetical protein [Bacteroidaceae bacterium]